MPRLKLPKNRKCSRCGSTEEVDKFRQEWLCRKCMCADQPGNPSEVYRQSLLEYRGGMYNEAAY